MPSVAFTIPPIAKVGMSEAMAREKRLKFRVKTTKASEWFTAIQTAEPTAPRPPAAKTNPSVSDEAPRSFLTT